MPASRPRVLEDSRSETSSTITNLKDRYSASNMPSSGISKSKKQVPSTLNGSSAASKLLANGAAGTLPELDPNLPRTDWQTMPSSVLHNYRHAHRLPIPSSYTKPHANLTLRSSPTALCSPSSILTRRRLRDLKHERRKSSHHINGKLKEREKEKDGERSSDRLKNAALGPTSLVLANHSGATPEDAADSSPSTAAQKLSHNALAASVRRHFNAQQLSESDVLARFLYVVHHSSSSVVQQLGIEGSAGDGRGVVMGSHGRAVERNDGASGGGDLGFRLRFRPEPKY